MPLNTGAALAVSLIPAAVILVYNLMETGVPGGENKNFVATDNQILESASSLIVKNISILTNSTRKHSIEEIIQKLHNSTISKSSLDLTTGSTAASTLLIDTTEPTSTTSISRIIYPKLARCCANVRVSETGWSGSCNDKSDALSDDISSNDVWNAPAYLMGTGVAMKFLLQTQTPTCKDGKFMGELAMSADAESAGHILPDGILKYKNEYYQPNEYCIRGAGQNKGALELQICNVNCSNPATPCVHKCCGYDEIYSMGMKGQRGGCLRMDSNRNESIWGPTLYDEYGGKLSAEHLAKVGITPHVIQSNPTSFRHLCPRNATTVFPYGKQVADFLASVLRYPFASLKFMMRKDGWLMNGEKGLHEDRNVPISRVKRTTKYCIDGVMNYGESEPFANLEEQTVLFLCLGGAEELTAFKDPKSENLVLAASSHQLQTMSTLPTTTTSTSTTEKLTTTTATTTTTKTATPTTTVTTTTTTKPTTTTEKPTTTTTTTSTTTTEKSTTTTTSATTTEKPTTTTTSTTTTEKPTTTTTSTTTTERPTTTLSTTVSTTTIPSTTTRITTPSTTTTPRPPPPPPSLPVCCPLDPDAGDDDDNGNEISHHCKSNINGITQKSYLNISSTTWTASPNFMFTHQIAKFRLQVKPLNCQKWKKAFVHNLGKLLSPSEPVLMPDGMLKMGDDYYRQGEFCVNGVFPNIVEVLVCKTNCSDPETPCVQKCCAPNEVYSLGVGNRKRGCVPLNQEDTPYIPTLYKNMGSKVTEEELKVMTPHLVQKYPPKFQYNCYRNVTLVFPFSRDVIQLMSPLAQINLEFRLRQDGRVIYKHPSIRDASGELIESAFSTFNFCVDGIRNFGESRGPYNNSDNQTILFVCAVNPPSSASS